MVYPYIRFNLEGGRIIYLQLIRVLPRLTRIVRLLHIASIQAQFYRKRAKETNRKKRGRQQSGALGA